MNTIEMRLARLEANVNALKCEMDETLKGAYERACEAQDVEAAAEYARKIRNNLLNKTDKYNTVDRVLNFDLPDSISMTNMVSAVTALIRGLKGINTNEWSVYRQHLRDITSQDGFPFNVDWGESPEGEVED